MTGGDLPTLDELEARLGDPHDPDNPVGYPSVLEADEQGIPLAAGERVIEGYGLGAECVPAAFGGRLTGLDRLVDALRAVVRRDCTLAMAGPVSTAIAALPVWLAGTAAQRARVADLLLRGGRLADVRGGLTGTRHGTGLVVSGTSAWVANLDRAEACTLAVGDSAAHRLLAGAPTAHMRRSRLRPVGLRGCGIHTVEMDGLRLDAADLLGPFPAVEVAGPAVTDAGAPVEGAGSPVGRAVATLTRVIAGGALVGVLDTQLRLALRFATRRRLYGRTVADLPYARSTMVGAYLDLLACDCLTTTALRAVHLAPEQAGIAAEATATLVPALLRDASYDLSVLIGARSQLREGDYAMFQKNLRDLPVAVHLHSGPEAARAALAGRLGAPGRLAEAAPAAVFATRAELPALDLDTLAGGPDGVGADGFAGGLPAVQQRLVPDGPVAALCARFVAELRELRAERAGPTTAARDAELAGRYAVLVAAGACLGGWLGRPGGDEAWVTGVLWRLAGRLGVETGPLPADVEQSLYEDLSTRRGAAPAFDLRGSRLAQAA